MIFVLLYETPMNIGDQLPHETHTAYESGFYKLKFGITTIRIS